MINALVFRSTGTDLFGSDRQTKMSKKLKTKRCEMKIFINN